jgi:hypothetical protein
LALEPSRESELAARIGGLERLLGKLTLENEALREYQLRELPRRTYYYEPKATPCEEILIDRRISWDGWSSHGMDTKELPNSFNVRDGSSTTRR